MSIVEDGHLGGYREGGDAATYYPDLWRWLVNSHGVHHVIDVGCGDGQAVDYFAKLGCDVLGVEGVPQPHDSILQHDYTLGRLELGTAWGPPFDLCWSCEFVEHVEERYVPNFLATFACADMILMTHAEPGQDGYHHVNCRPADYWVGALAAIGYRKDEPLTLAARALAANNDSPWNHFRRSGLAFRRAET